MNDYVTKEEFYHALKDINNFYMKKTDEILKATSQTFGGIKADAAEENDTLPIRIGEDGKLYAEPYSESLPLLYHGTIDEAITDAEFTEINGNPISLSEVKVRTCFKTSEASWCAIEIWTSAVNPNNVVVKSETGGTYTTAEKLYVSSVDAKISDGNFELSGFQPVVFTAYNSYSNNVVGASHVKSIPNITYHTTADLQEKNADNGKINKIRIYGSFSKLEVIIWGR